MSSEELVEVLLQTFWAVATAFTTDINWKTRDWLITRFNQAYFDKAKKHVEKLVALDKKCGSDQVVLESFRDGYESVLLQVAGKPVTRVNKPLWSDLESQRSSDSYQAGTPKIATDSKIASTMLYINNPARVVD